MGLSKLAGVCKACPYVDDCDDKRMEACGYLTMPNVAAPSVEQSGASMVEPILRETMTIMINGEPTIRYKDEIEKQLYKQLYCGLGLHYGA